MLERHRERELDLEALCRAAQRVLAAYPSSDDGRVQDRPDPRTVRYYQSLGLVDRPVRYEGRQAMHVYRHLLQLVAIKRLQAAGHSLSQLQKSLAGLGTDRLEAALRDGLVPAPPGSAARAGGTRRGGSADREVGPPHGSRPSGEQSAGRQKIAAEVARGITVVIDPSLVPDPERLLDRLTVFLSGDQP